MYGFELVVAVLSLAGTVYLWFPWFLTASTVDRTIADPAATRGVLLGPLLAIAVMFTVLRGWASWDVRESPFYLGYYVLLGAAWLPAMLRLSVLLGFHPREDVIERRNPAARIVWFGALAGHTFAFSGANIGDGPGVEVVLFAASLASGAVLATWALYQLFVDVVEQVTVERSRPAALGLAGLLAGAGLVAGRGAAGNWVGAGSTVADFLACVWPLPVVVVVLSVLHRVSAPSVAGARGGAAVLGVSSVFGGFVIPCLAVLWVRYLGRW